MLLGICVPLLYCLLHLFAWMLFEPKHDKTNKMIYAPSDDSDQTRCPHEETLGP